MTMFDKFKKYDVHASSIEDFCNRYHTHAAYHGRGKDYMKYDLKSHIEEFEKYGYTFIPSHDSTTGEEAAYYG